MTSGNKHTSALSDHEYTSELERRIKGLELDKRRLLERITHLDIARSQLHEKVIEQVHTITNLKRRIKG